MCVCVGGGSASGDASNQIRVGLAHHEHRPATYSGRYSSMVHDKVHGIIVESSALLFMVRVSR